MFSNINFQSPLSVFDSTRWRHKNVDGGDVNEPKHTENDDHDYWVLIFFPLMRFHIFACVQIKTHCGLVMSLLQSVCPHVRALQSPNRPQLNLWKWLRMIHSPHFLRFIPKYPLLALLRVPLVLSLHIQGQVLPFVAASAKTHVAYKLHLFNYPDFSDRWKAKISGWYLIRSHYKKLVKSKNSRSWHYSNMTTVSLPLSFHFNVVFLCFSQ